MKLITIADIAKKSGASPATVARVVHKNGYVSKEKRKLVEGVIQELGYVPNRVARGLRNQRTNSIGHVLPLSNENPIFTLIGSAVNAAAESAGFHVLTITTQGDPAKERMLIEDLVGLMVEAIVFTAETSCSAEDIEWVLSHGIPVVMLERPRNISGIDVVLLDSFEGARLAVEHLHDSGHRKIAFIGVNPERHFVDLRRYKGFLSAAEQYAMEIPEQWIYLMPDYQVQYGFQAMESLLAGGVLPTCIFAASDILASGALQCLYAHKIRIPDDISIVGYDNTLSLSSVPPLTSIELQPQQIGASAIELILERKNGLRTGARSITLSPSLVERHSVKILNSI